MKEHDSTIKPDGNAIAPNAGGSPIIPRAGGGVIIPRAGGGVIIPRTSQGPIIFKAGGGPIIPRFGLVVGGGWQPDIPDVRDHSLNTPKFREPLRQAKARLAATDSVELPERVDHRNFCSPIENQETLGSCTAHAVVGLLEYMIKRGLGEAPDLARLFLY